MGRLDRSAWRLLSRATERGLNAPPTSSAGRLFDAVASLLGLRDRVDFDGASDSPAWLVPARRRGGRRRRALERRHLAAAADRS